MNKIRIKTVNIVLSLTLLSCITGCISNTDIVDEKEYYPLKISVKDQGYASSSDLKTTESNYKTYFTKGDQIGLYVVDSSGTIEAANVCLTYDSVNWNYPEDTVFYYDSTSTKRYFAYYPYQSTLTDAPTSTSTATDAATFFADVISDWTLTTDQSTKAKYTACDLMVGEGTVGEVLSNATRLLTFSMCHQMGLVDMEFPYYYLSTDKDYTYTLGLTCPDFSPYHLSNGNYRYIIKPATATAISGYYCATTSANVRHEFDETLTVAAGTYQAMNVDSQTATSHTLCCGDYYLNDGSLIPSSSTNSYLLQKAIGVVFDTTTSTTDQGYGWTHGYAMALRNTEDSCIWSANANDEALTNYTDYTVYIENKDGYTETQTIKNSSVDTYSETNYPAFWYALNFGTSNESTTASYAAPATSSGWFLPSIGQWWDICINLGGLSTTPDNAADYYCEWLTPGGTTFITNVNAYLEAVRTYGCAIDLFTESSTSTGDYQGYWSSTESSSAHVFGMFPSIGDDIYLTYNGYGYMNKPIKKWKVRPAIAF